MPALEQIPLKNCPHGLAHPVALLDIAPAALEQAFGLKFERERDDLDDFDGAIVRSERGLIFALVYHLHAPIKGTQILINERSSTPREDLAKALRTLAPAKAPELWVHPKLKAE